MAVPIELGAKPRLGSPEALFQGRLEETADPQYDVTSDGQRFLLNRALINPIAVVLGWPHGGVEAHVARAVEDRHRRAGRGAVWVPLSPGSSTQWLTPPPDLVGKLVTQTRPA